MTDREKVIKGLEETEIMLSQAVDRGGEMSVIGAFNCLNRVTDALALLKEHEPHLMTLDEIQNAKDIPAYWFEDDEGYMTSSLSTIYDWYGHNISFVTEDKEGYLEGYTYLDTQYGKTWRCWSAWPTDEQRKAVKWDE